MNERLIPPPADTSWLKTESASGRRPFLAHLHALLCRPGLAARITRMENTMSALTEAVDRLTASVDAANDRITTLLQPLQTALAAAQAELADLRVQDEADKAALEAALTDATTATERILDEVSQVDALGATPTEPTEPGLPENPEVGPEPTGPEA